MCSETRLDIGNGSHWTQVSSQKKMGWVIYIICSPLSGYLERLNKLCKKCWHFYSKRKQNTTTTRNHLIQIQTHKSNYVDGTDLRAWLTVGEKKIITMIQLRYNQSIQVLSIIQNVGAWRQNSVIAKVFFQSVSIRIILFLHRYREMSKKKAEWNKSKSKVLEVESESLSCLKQPKYNLIIVVNFKVKKKKKNLI